MGRCFAFPFGEKSTVCACGINVNSITNLGIT